MKFDVLHSFFVGSLDKIGGTSHHQRSNNYGGRLPAKATALALVFILALLFLLLLTLPSSCSTVPGFFNFCFDYLLAAFGLASGRELLPLFVDECSLFLVQLLQIQKKMFILSWLWLNLAHLTSEQDIEVCG